MRASTDASGISTVSSRSRRPCLSICSSITGASNAIAAASAATARHPASLNSCPSSSSSTSTQDVRRPGTSRSARAAGSRRRRGRAGSRRGTCRTPRPRPRARRDRAALQLLRVVRPLRRAGRRRARRPRGPSAASGANAAWAPPAEAAAPRTSRRSASSRTAFGASDAIIAASSSADDLAEIELRDLDLGLRDADLLQPVEQRAELERREEPPDLVGVPLPHHAVLGLDVQRQVGDDPRELLVQGQLVRRRQQRCPSASRGARPRARAAPRPSRTPGSASRRSSRPPPERRGCCRRGRLSAPRTRGTSRAARRTVPPRRPRRTGRCRRCPRRLNITWIPGRTSWKKSRSAVTITASIPVRGPHGERADRVVGLVVDDPDHRDVQRVEHLVDQPELRREVGGRLGPARLVVGVLLQPDGRPAEVEGHREVVGMLVAQQLDQHGREPVDRVRDLPGARGERRREREERAVRERVPVEQEDPFASVVPGGGRHAADSSRRRRRPRPGSDRAGQMIRYRTRLTRIRPIR